MNECGILLVNLETCESFVADYYRLCEMGIPEGYVEASDVTDEEWIEVLQKMRDKNE